jgi:hypothetical protein
MKRRIHIALFGMIIFIFISEIFIVFLAISVKMKALFKFDIEKEL